MTAKYTQEFIEKEYKDKGYILINKYINNKTKLFLYDEEGYICSSTWNKFQQECTPSKFCKSNPYTIQNIKRFIELNATGYEIISTEYKNNNTQLLFRCPEGHEFNMSWSHFQQGRRCSKCSHHQPSEETVIYNSTPWMIELGISEEDAKKYTPQSSKYIEVICPHCNQKKQIKISQIYRTKSIGCICGDGISFSEKILASLLNQLNIKYTKEYKPEWSNNRRYDFYLNDYNVIIETHGKQHYMNDFSYCGGRTLEEERENDQYKKELALNNKIDNYIILDCRESNINYTKNSILNSELSKLFDLSNIDWLKCEEFALSNKVKEVCDYWHIHNDINNENLTTTDIGKVFNLKKPTIYKYLKQGLELGWCNYDGEEETRKSGNLSNHNKKPIEIFKDDKSLGIFESAREIDRQSEELFGVKLNYKGISNVCTGRANKHKGFTFKYVDKQN